MTIKELGFPRGRKSDLTLIFGDRRWIVTFFGMISGNGSKDLCPGGTKGKRGPRTDNRRFLDALLWMARSGGRWRDLPERFGNYHSVKRRYYRWIAMGVLDAMLAALAREVDLEWLMIDLTIVRAHQHAAGARKAKGGRMPRAWAGLGAG